jgi:hypothetical protein
MIVSIPVPVSSEAPVSEKNGRYCLEVPSFGTLVKLTREEVETVEALLNRPELPVAVKLGVAESGSPFDGIWIREEDLEWIMKQIPQDA